MKQISILIFFALLMGCHETSKTFVSPTEMTVEPPAPLILTAPPLPKAISPSELKVVQEKHLVQLNENRKELIISKLKTTIENINSILQSSSMQDNYTISFMFRDYEPEFRPYKGSFEEFAALLVKVYTDAGWSECKTSNDTFYFRVYLKK